MVEYKNKADIGIITLNNPPGNNLLDPQFLVIEQLDTFIIDNKLKGLLICGTGRHFSNGADLNNLKELTAKQKLAAQLAKGKDILNYIENLEIPVTACVKGVCFGGGLEIALAAHFIQAADNALFAFPEAGNDLIPGLGGTLRINRRLAKSQALYLLLSADIINAQKALQNGLIDDIKPADEIFDFSFNYLLKLTENKPLKVINYLIRSLNNYYKMSFEEALHKETELFCELASDQINK